MPTDDTSTTATDDTAATDTATTDTTATDTTTDWQAEAEKYKALARKHEERAKANAASAKELEAVKQQSMTDVEKATAQARAEGRAEALKETGLRLVDAEVKAAAAGRKVDVDALLDGLDRSRFLTDDGDPDSKAIAAWVDRIAPKAGSVDLGQGTRSSGSGGQDMNALLRNAAGRAQ